MLLSDSSPFRSIPASLFLALAVMLSGCASKNPLLEESAATSAKPPATGSAAANEKSASAATPDSDVKAVSKTRMQRLFGIFTPYRVDIQQGNFVSREMMSQLKEAMSRPDGVSREQARFILGTPLLTDILHADRWDYVFRLQKGNGDLITSRVALFFKGNRLDHVDGSDLPTERDYLSLLIGAAPVSKEPVLAPASSPPPAPDSKSEPASK